MSDELFKTYIVAVLKAENNWQQNFVLPYGSAYTTARKANSWTTSTSRKRPMKNGRSASRHSPCSPFRFAAAAC